MRGSGLSGAGLNVIVRVSGAPKGSVYDFFPGRAGDHRAGRSGTRTTFHGFLDSIQNCRFREATGVGLRACGGPIRFESTELRVTLSIPYGGFILGILSSATSISSANAPASA